MREYLTLVKLEFLNGAKRANKKSTKVLSLIFKLVLGLAVFALFEVLILFAFNSILNMAIQTTLEGEFLIFFVLIVQVVQLLFGVGLTTKTLFFSPDEDKLKLPVSGTAILLSKMTYLFIKELVFSLVLSLPILIMFGIKTGAGVGFYLMIIPDILLIAIVPFFLSLLLSIPAMYIVSFLRNKFVITLILYVAFVAAGFYVYIAILKVVMTILQTSNFTSLISDGAVFKIKNAASNMFLQVLFRNIATQSHFLPSLFVYLSVCLVIGGLVFIFSNKWYFRILVANLESPNGTFSKETQIKHRSVQGALLNREFLNIFRSVNYSFQYLTVAITTPLMVYFSSAIASNVGIDQLGQGILPGLSVLVLIMFLSVGSSFAATSVTREGENFFHSKIIPVTFRKQISIKFLMYCIVIIPSILLSCLGLVIGEFLSLAEALIIFAGVSIVMIGNIAKSIDIDIKKPKFIYVGSKEMVGTNANVSTSLGIGFITATLVGVASIVVSFIYSLPASTIVLFGFAVPFCAIEVFKLFYKLEQKYQRIEV